MSSNDIQEIVEKLVGDSILVELDDLPMLADLHTLLQSVEKYAASEKMDAFAQSAGKAVNSVEDIILDQAKNPETIIKNVGKFAGTAQAIVCDNADPASLPFPDDFEVDASTASSALTQEELLASLPAHVDEQILSEFLTRQPTVLDDMESLALTLEKEEDEEKLRELRRLIHTLKGEAGMLGMNDVSELCHATEEILGEHPKPGVTDVLLDIRDWLSRIFDCYQGKGEAPGSCGDLIKRISGEEVAEAAPAEMPEEAAESETPEEAKPELGSPKVLDGDPALMGEFVAEALEHLENADVHLLTLETEPKDPEALNAVFRAFHTIKGVAGFLDVEQIQALSHESENLLDRARKEELTLQGVYIDITFDAVDQLKNLVNLLGKALSTGDPLEYDHEVPVLVKRLQALLSGEIEEIEIAEEQEALPETNKKIGEVLVERGVASPGAVEAAVHKQFMGLECRKLGEILRNLNMITQVQLDEAAKIQKKSGGAKKLGEILLDMGAITGKDLGTALENQETAPKAPRVGETLVRSGEAPAKEVAHVLRAQQRAQRTVEVRETVKVDAERLDRMIDLVGEIVIAEAMLGQHISADNSSDVMRYLVQLDKITRELQEMGTSLRMIPVKATFQKMARLARDVAKKANKKIEFVMNGEDTELDKGVVDKIGDPLVHMVRNSVDHGIEATGENRLGAGKPVAGRVELRAFHKGGNIYIEIEDDGRGLDRDAILAKAVERGIVKDGESMADEDIWKLIFEPGFSTAKTVTEVSGRGVGMDVVRRNIESLRGKVDIKSTQGKGSLFSIRLPLTLAIIDGMVVRVGKERYIIPTLSVVRSIQPVKEDLFTVVDKGEMLSLQGELIPLFRLHKLLDIPDAQTDLMKALVLIVEDAGKRTGLLVDELLGQQQIVIKSLGEAMQGLSGISGGAIMSDGVVGLILDVGGLVQLAHS